jgi:tetratricopeptide (TPR) repeat protein/tRNA A-37 threonylcarbamoyl transferase component Bud32
VHALSHGDTAQSESGRDDVSENAAQGYGSPAGAATVPFDPPNTRDGLESGAGALETIDSIHSSCAADPGEGTLEATSGDAVDIPIGTSEPPDGPGTAGAETVADSEPASPPLEKTEVFASGSGPPSSGSYGNGQEQTLEQMMASSYSEDTGEFTALGQAWIEKTVADAGTASTAGPKSAPAGYEIVNELGRGGMGIVYKARHLRLNRLVALKMIRGAYADEIQHARFKIEAEAVATLRHPNILQIYDIGEHNGAPYVALELLEGGSLADRLNRNPLTPVQAAQWLLPLVQAVAAAHRAGIVHRDLKSANILFTVDGIPKITDFGLAKRLELDEGQTHTGQIMGTPSYMAPEQARGETKSAGPPADVYALGAILYEMLTGRPPFKGVSAMDTVKQVLEEDPVSPSRVQFRVPRDLETICMKCLQKEPRKRFASAEELADDLNRYLRGEPIRARRTPPVERAVKWGKRRPALATLIACSTLAVVTLVSAGLWYWYHKVAQERSALVHQSDVANQTANRLLLAREAISKQDLDGAKDILARQKERLDTENIPALRNLLKRTADMLREVDTALDEQLALQKVRERYRNFVDLHKEAIFRDTQYPGLQLPAGRDLPRKTAEKALGVYATRKSEDDWQLGELPPTLSKEQQTQVGESCYELLLILAEVDANRDPAQIDRSLRILDCADRLRPEHTRAYHLRRASLLARKGDSAGSDRELKLAESVRPDTAFDYYLSGQEHYKRDERLPAIGDLENARMLKPDHFWANCLLAICYNQVSHYEAAQACVDFCIAADREFPWLYLLRGYASGERAAVYLRDIKADTTEQAASNLRNAANEEFAHAEADLRKALELLRSDPDAELQYGLLVNRGLLRFRRDHLDEAAADYLEAIRLKPDAYPAHVNLARLYQKQGKRAEAIEQFSRAIALKPDLAPLYRERAALTVRDLTDSTPAQRAAALEDLKLAISRERPNDPMLAMDHTNRGNILYHEERYKAALEECRLALEKWPDYGEAHVLRIKTLLKLNRLDDTIRSCDAALARGKKSPLLYELRALALAKHSDYAGAIRDYGRALDLRPNDGKLLNGRGWQYLFAECPNLALIDFEKALELDSHDVQAHLGRGATLARMRDHRGAVFEAREALSLGKITPLVAYSAARIYAIAATVAAAETGENGRFAKRLSEHYENNALQWIKQAFEREVPERRAVLWRDMIETDPALNTIKRRLKYEDLVAPNKNPGS